MPPCAHKPQPFVGKTPEEYSRLKATYFSPLNKPMFQQPVHVVEGSMQWLFDRDGNRYLDLFGGICTVGVGHCHPRVTDALVTQAKKLWHTTTIYRTELQLEYAAALVGKLPAGTEWQVFFTNSGSEATDLATVLARTHSGNWPIIALRHAYHGMSEGSRGITNQGSYRTPGPTGFGIIHTLNPDGYRGVFSGQKDAVQRYVADVRDNVADTCGGKVAGFIAETIQGVNGTVPLLDGYLPHVYDVVRAAGGVTIADEVQGGFGRTGSHFWSFERQGVVPDIVTMAKSIGNGYPLAAVAARKELWDQFSRKAHFNTFGGSPLASAVGLEVLRVIEDERLPANCAARGAELISGLHGLAAKHACIGDVRGAGLLLGVDIVSDRAAKTPSAPRALAVLEALKGMGVLCGRGGQAGNVIRIKPPMCLTKQDVAFALEVFDKALVAGDTA